MSDRDFIPELAGERRFRTTHWSVILEAADRQNVGFEQALALLCRSYWLPVYAYVRRKGHAPESAQDLTQGFFTQMIEKNYVRSARRDKGKFRTFLLVAVQRYLLNEYDRAQAKKRGGDRTLIPLELDDAEVRYRLEPAGDDSPEKTFQRRWALTLVDNVYGRLRDELLRSQPSRRVELLMGFLTGDAASKPYADAARELQISETAVKSAVHRMRRRYGVLLREEVAATVDASTDVDDEIRHLFAVLEV